MSTVALSPSAQIGQLIERSRQRFADGMQLADFAGIFLDAMRLSIAAVDAIPMEPAARKALVVEFAGDIFDQFAGKLIPPMAWPFWLLARSTVRAAFLAFAGGVIESLLPVVREASK
jgi:hypothetical protein